MGGRPRPKPRTDSPWLLAGGGILLLALYVLPLYAPPGPVPPPVIGPETSLWSRLFPQVPEWMGLRLAALAAGALMLAWAGRDADLDRPTSRAAADAPTRHTPLVRWCELGAFAVALLLAAAGTQVPHLPHWWQFAHVLALAVPAALLYAADAAERPSRPPSASPDRRWWGGVAILIAVFLVWRIALARHDPRAADLVDMWKNFTFFLDAGRAPSLGGAQTYEVGVSNLYLLAIGLPFISSGLAEPTFAWIQGFHAVWIVLTAVGVAALARRIGGAPAMLPAVAALLFSPFMLSMALCVAPFAFMTALVVFLPLLVCRIYEHPARGDVAALGAVAGLAGIFPHLTLWAAAASLSVAPWLLRRRPPLIVWGTATLCGLASVLPMVPALFNLSGMSEMYLQRRGVALELEQLIMGQKFYTHREVAALWESGIRGAFDVPLAALLQGWAILRSPVRLSADVYFEPLAAALAAVGVIAAVGSLRRSTTARLLCGAMALGLLPAVASATDRASLTRNLVLPVVLPLFTLVGIAVASRAFRLRLRPAWLDPALAVAITASGVFLFDSVFPRILPTTWLSLALEALARTPPQRVLLFEPGNPPNDWLHIAEIGRYLPREPLATRAYLDGGSLLASADGDAPAAPLMLWSPSLEQQASVQRDLCTCWPRATVFTLQDRAGLSRAFAASLEEEWEPALPATQWSASPCPATSPPTCGTLRAMAHNTLGQGLAQRGQADAAVAEYREALRLDPNYAPAHISLGLMLESGGRSAEAIEQYLEALRLNPTLAAAHNNLAIALENLGRGDEAMAHYREALRLAPSDTRTRMNMGAALAGRGQVEEAIEQFREVLVLAPYMPEAHVLLADALMHQNQIPAAIGEYRLALRDRAGWPPAADALAWVLLTAPDPALRDPREALELANLAVRNTRGDEARFLRTLAVAQAANGELAEAAAAAERGLEAARATHQDDLARDLAARLAEYRRPAGR